MGANDPFDIRPSYVVGDHLAPIPGRHQIVREIRPLAERHRQIWESTFPAFAVDGFAVARKSRCPLTTSRSHLSQL